MEIIIEKVKSIFNNRKSNENTDWLEDINTDLYDEYIDFTGYTAG